MQFFYAETGRRSYVVPTKNADTKCGDGTAILYIINDYNNKVKAGKPRGLHTYLKSWNAKIIPILLTIISTMLGFIPFLIGDISEFWFSLAIGTMSGLAFSLLVLMIVLPVMFKVKNSKI